MASNSQNKFEKNQAGRLSDTSYQDLLKATMMKTVWLWCKERQVDQGTEHRVQKETL